MDPEAGLSQDGQPIDYSSKTWPRLAWSKLHYVVQSPAPLGSNSSSNSGDGQDAAAALLQQRRSSISSFLPHEPVPNRPTRYRTVLHDQSGYVHAGSILLVLGASGAGKTSLLRALADRLPYGVSGSILLDGLPLARLSYSRRTKLIASQTDLFPNITVRETLLYAHRFYCSGSSPEHQKQRVQKIDRMLELLALDTVASRLVTPALTAAQQKRISIAIELLAEPQILFIDDPTSDMDSLSAAKCLECIMDITRETKTTVILATSSPTAQLLTASDTTLLLARGRTLYFGPTVEISSYLATRGCPVPDHASLGEWLIQCASPEFGAKRTTGLLATEWRSSDRAAKLKTYLEFVDVQLENSKMLSIGRRSRSTKVGLGSISHQTRWLMQRKVSTWTRRPSDEALRLATYFCFALLIGGIWLQVGKSTPEQADSFMPKDHSIRGALFSITVITTTVASFSLLTRATEHRVTDREYQNGSYSAVSLIFAQTVVDVLLALLASSLSGTVLFWMIGLDGGFPAFLRFLVVLFLTTATSDGLACFVWSISPKHASIGFLFVLILLAMASMACGFLIGLGDISWAFRWVPYITAHMYSLSAFEANQGISRPAPASGPAGFWRNIGGLAALGILYRLFALVILSGREWRGRQTSGSGGLKAWLNGGRPKGTRSSDVMRPPQDFVVDDQPFEGGSNMNTVSLSSGSSLLPAKASADAGANGDAAAK